MNAPQAKHLLIIVDDNKDYCQSFKLYFEANHNYEVRTASNARAAVELARTLDRPATLLMDLHIGGRFDGVDLIKKMHRRARFPLIGIYNSADTKAKIKAIRMGGAIYYLVKPGPEDLDAYIEELRAYVETVVPEQVFRFREMRRDPLTGLYDRREFFELAMLELDLALRNKTPTSVMFIDGDNVKNVNDTFGHEAGDTVIQEIARCIKEQRSTDQAGRWGGDEFVVVLSGSTEDQARMVANRLERKIAQTRIKLDAGEEIFAQVSIGIAAVDPDAINHNDLAETLTDLINRSDSEMQKVKRTKGAKRG